MTFEYCVTREGNSNNIMKWAKGEAELGLTKSLFIGENGMVKQYVDAEEGERFFVYVEAMTEDKFDKIVKEFFEGLEEKDLQKMHKGLAVFDEMDEFNLGTEDMKKRLLRIRENTHEEAYQFSDDGYKDFVIYKQQLYLLK